MSRTALTASLFIAPVRTVGVAITQPALGDTASLVVTTQRTIFSGLPAAQLVRPIGALLSPITAEGLLNALVSVQTPEEPYDGKDRGFAPSAQSY